jgi:hypothetical protein
MHPRITHAPWRAGRRACNAQHCPFGVARGVLGTAIQRVRCRARQAVDRDCGLQHTIAADRVVLWRDSNHWEAGLPCRYCAWSSDRKSKQKRSRSQLAPYGMHSSRPGSSTHHSNLADLTVALQAKMETVCSSVLCWPGRPTARTPYRSTMTALAGGFSTTVAVYLPPTGVGLASRMGLASPRGWLRMAPQTRIAGLLGEDVHTSPEQQEPCGLSDPPAPHGRPSAWHGLHSTGGWRGID